MDGMTENRTRTDLTRVLAEKASALGYDDLPAPVRAIARQCVLDYLGVAFAGAQDPLVRILLDEMTEAGGSQQASIIGHNVQLPALPAALVGSPADFSNMKSFTSSCLVVQCSCACSSGAWTAAAWITSFVRSFMICSLENRGANLTCNTAKDDRRAALGCSSRKRPIIGPNVRYTRLPCAFLCPALRVAAVGLQRESA